MKPTPRQIRSGAEAIANARGARRGVPRIANIWDVLPPKLQAEVLEDAEAALTAAAAEESDDAGGAAAGEDTLLFELVEAVRAERDAVTLEATVGGSEPVAISARRHADELRQAAVEKIDRMGL